MLYRMEICFSSVRNLGIRREIVGNLMSGRRRTLTRKPEETLGTVTFRTLSPAITVVRKDISAGNAGEREGTTEDKKLAPDAIFP